MKNKKLVVNIVTGEDNVVASILYRVGAQTIDTMEIVHSLWQDCLKDCDRTDINLVILRIARYLEKETTERTSFDNFYNNPVFKNTHGGIDAFDLSEFIKRYGEKERFLTQANDLWGVLSISDNRIDIVNEEAARDAYIFLDTGMFRSTSFCLAEEDEEVDHIVIHGQEMHPTYFEANLIPEMFQKMKDGENFCWLADNGEKVTVYTYD